MVNEAGLGPECVPARAEARRQRIAYPSQNRPAERASGRRRPRSRRRPAEESYFAQRDLPRRRPQQGDGAPTAPAEFAGKTAAGAPITAASLGKPDAKRSA